MFLRVKLIDFYTKFNVATKTDLIRLKQALQTINRPTCGFLKLQPMKSMAEKLVDECMSELRCFFNHTYPDESMYVHHSTATKVSNGLVTTNCS